MCVVVIGVNGFVGCVLVEWLWVEGDDVVVIDW